MFQSASGSDIDTVKVSRLRQCEELTVEEALKGLDLNRMSDFKEEASIIAACLQFYSMLDRSLLDECSII